MKKISIARSRIHNPVHAGASSNHLQRKVRGRSSGGNLLDLDALDIETRRAVQIVLHRMPRECRLALIHAANVEAVMDLPAGYMTKPWAAPFFEDPQYRDNGHRAYVDLEASSYNPRMRPAKGRLLSLIGAIHAGKPCRQHLNDVDD